MPKKEANSTHLMWAFLGPRKKHEVDEDGSCCSVKFVTFVRSLPHGDKSDLHVS